MHDPTTASSVGNQPGDRPLAEPVRPDDRVQHRFFRDRIAVVTGAATGIGAALTARLIESGARVLTIDIAPVAAEVEASIECDLGDQGSIEAALAALPPRVDALFNCAGVPNGGRFNPHQVMAVNWFGLRHLTECLLDRIPPEGSVTHVASTAGRGWPERVAELGELMAIPDLGAGAAWVDDNAELVGDGYALSKQAVQWYTMARALEILPKFGVRMNSICPGVTDTQIAADFRRGVGDAVIDRAVQIAGRLARPDEMAPAMLFLADPTAAGYINGVNLNVDRGTGAAHNTGAW